MSASVGFAENLLGELSAINPDNYPGKKVTQPGFLLGLAQNSVKPMTTQFMGLSNDGHRVPQVNVKYMERSTPEEWQTGAPDCGIDVSPAYKETAVMISQSVNLGLFFPEDTIRQYEREASRYQNALGGTPMMSAIVDGILTKLQGGYQKINQTLLTTMSTKFGYNHRPNPSSTNVTVNFNDDGTTNSFSENWGRIAADMEINEICGGFFATVTGNPHVWAKQYAAKALSANQSGLNNAAIADMLGGKFYYDANQQAILGANTLAIFATNSVHFLEYDKHVGDFSGNKGAIIDFQIADPFMQCWNNGQLEPFKWDVTLRYNDCPTTYSGYAGSASYGKGWHVIISKSFDLFTTPTNAYNGGDRISGQNSTLLYTITNS